MRARFCASRACLAAALALIALTAPVPAVAVCSRLMGDPVWVDDPQGSVFIGTAEETRANGQNALFHVEEIWMGDPLPEWQILIGSQDEMTLWEDQPIFADGGRYLIVAHWYNETLVPGGCGGTQPYSDTVAALRPPDVALPTPAPRPAFSAWWPPPPGVWEALQLGALLLVLGIVASPLWRRHIKRGQAAPSKHGGQW